MATSVAVATVHEVIRTEASGGRGGTVTKDCGTCSKGERLQALVSGKTSRELSGRKSGGS